MPRKRVPRIYFTKDTEDAIIEYNKTDDQRIKNKLYKDRIQHSFEKLAEIVYNKLLSKRCKEKNAKEQENIAQQKLKAQEGS